MKMDSRPIRLYPGQEQADDELNAKRVKAKQGLHDARATKQREIKEARSAAEERKRSNRGCREAYRRRKK